MEDRKEQIRDALERNNLRALRRIIVPGESKENNAALVNACRRPSLEIIRFLVDNGADIHVANDRPLYEAVRYNRNNIVRFLIERGADVNSENGRCLLKAIQMNFTDENNINVIRTLLNAGAVVTEEMLLLQSDPEVLSLLLQNFQGDINSDNGRILRTLIENDRIDPETIRTLLNNGATVGLAESLQHIENYLANNFDPDDEENTYIEIEAILRERLGLEVIDRRNRMTEEERAERTRAAREQEEKNEHLRSAAIDEIKNREEKVSENPFIEANCSSTENLYGDPLKDTDDIVVFEIDGNKGDCYLKEELKLLRSDQYVRGVGEKAYKLPWSNIWITKSLKEAAENMQGTGPIKLVKSNQYVGYSRSNVLWVEERT